MFIVIFFIPEALLCVLGGILLTLGLATGEAASVLSVWGKEHYWIVIAAVVLLLLAIAIRYAQKVNIPSAFAGLFAVSPPVNLLLDTLHDIFLCLGDGFNGLFAVVICSIFLFVYCTIHFGILCAVFADNIASGRSGSLWLCGVIGWIVTLLLFG